jgi:hypothetical protein
VLSFSGEPSSDGFAKCYELHYQLKKVAADGFKKFQQFGVINFHGKCGGKVGLTPATKNKWSAGWTMAWFYCKAPLHPCPQGGKTIHALRSHMSTLNFPMKPSIQDSVEDLSDDAFLWACKNIGGRDAVEEFMSCGIWLLSAGVDFEHVKVGVTPASQLTVLLPSFPLSCEDGVKLIVRVEQEARNIMGGYVHAEHEACTTSLPNNGRLNRVLEVVGVAYGSCPLPVSAEVLKKREADAIAKVLAKRPKVTEKKGAGLAKVSGLHASGGSKWPSGADIPPAKSAKLSKGIVPRAITSAATTCIMPEMCISKVSAGAGGAKGGGRHLGCKTVPDRRLLPLLKSALSQPSGLWLHCPW